MRTLLVLLVAATTAAAESIWIEAEHLSGIKGSCWPSGKPEMRKTAGHWGISGPGWAGEWVQGGESGFLSIACGADDAAAVATTDVEVPVAGKYRVWVRFRESRGTTSRFQVTLTPPGKPAVELDYGKTPNVEDDNEMKLYWNWAFAWEGHEAELPAGKTRLDLRSSVAQADCRQVDCIVLTTDLDYRPQSKERPRHPSRDALESLRTAKAAPPLARRTVEGLPPSWVPKTYRDEGFRYLWNMPKDVKWAGDDPKRVPVPYHVADEETRKAFEAMYAGKADVPIFGDPRIVPVFHGPGPYLLDNPAFVKWLDADPKRRFGHLLNYHPDTPVSPAAKKAFVDRRDRFVGAIAGESTGYFSVPPEAMKAATANAKTRRDLAEAITKTSLAANAAKYKTVYGEDWPDAYREVIPCQSVMMTAHAPLCYPWGARTVGFESSAITGGVLAMKMAFLRGAARQHGGMTATYRSCNFGDSATMFSEQGNYSKPRNLLDNYYSVYSGAGMTWYKFDVWHQYMAGAAMFYHEQGFDEFWMPGGTTAAGLHPVQLSPKGKIVDRFLRVTAKETDRGSPFTPVAFLVDYAHGWDPSPYAPEAFGGEAGRPDIGRYGDHERMLHEWFWTAYHPIGKLAESPTTGTSEVNVPGVFGNVFDVVYAYPDVKKWTTIDQYPVVVAVGDLPLTADEGKRLAKYVDDGGTLLVSDEAGAFAPQEAGQVEAEGFRWEDAAMPSQRFRFRPIVGGTPLATTTEGKVFCSAFDRGKGRLIVLSVPRGLGIDRTIHPVVPRLLAALTAGQTPVTVDGDVEWMLNRTKTGWIVTLFNPAGQHKPQQGISPTDYRENRQVTIRTTRPVATARDWLYPDEALTPRDGHLKLTVQAGSVRVVELKEK